MQDRRWIIRVFAWRHLKGDLDKLTHAWRRRDCCCGVLFHAEIGLVAQQKAQLSADQIITGKAIEDEALGDWGGGQRRFGISACCLDVSDQLLDNVIINIRALGWRRQVELLVAHPLFDHIGAVTDARRTGGAHKAKGAQIDDDYQGEQGCQPQIGRRKACLEIMPEINDCGQPRDVDSG